MTTICVIIFAASLAAAGAYTGPDLPPGPYCGLDGQCCVDRQDGCSHPILDTLCYCDDFCGRNRQYDDCCPDYLPVCKKIEVASEIVAPTCQHNGKVYLSNQQRRENCNTCTCSFDSYTNQTRWDCTFDECIIEDRIVNTVNRMNAGWRAANYSQFYGKKLTDGLIYKLGTLELDRLTRRMNAIESPNMDVHFPPSFDARERWPGYISRVKDQGWCGSDWAVSTAAIASDRFAILSKGAETSELSAQMLISCIPRHQQACSGGHVDVAWNFARSWGLVDEQCFPYMAEKTTCRFQPRGNLLSDGCRHAGSKRTERYRVGPIFRLKGERSIMADIMQSGPVQAIMKVYQDFFHYRDGVYKRSFVGNTVLSGLHSVRVIGWGEDRGRKYWLVANSWGENWGENGYFRIARGNNESGVEDFILSSLAEVNGVYKRK